MPVSLINFMNTPERLDWMAGHTRCHLPMHHPEIQFGEVFEIKAKGKHDALAVCHIRHPQHEE